MVNHSKIRPQNYESEINQIHSDSFFNYVYLLLNISVMENMSQDEYQRKSQAMVSYVTVKVSTEIFLEED